MTTEEADLVTRLVAGLTTALKRDRAKAIVQRPLKVAKFSGKPCKVGEPTIREWLDEVDNYMEQCSIPEDEQAKVVVNHLSGVAREEINSCCNACSRSKQHYRSNKRKLVLLCNILLVKRGHPQAIRALLVILAGGADKLFAIIVRRRDI